MMLREFAPAKINLSLHVGPPGADGRHPLESIVAFANVGDWIWAEESDRPSLRLAGPFAGALAHEQDNLVVRAARLLAKEAGVRTGVTITLDKHLPIASGVGGGSADAAATLRILNRLWSLDWSLDDLARLAAELGADTPACVLSRSCVMSGGGERLAPLTLPSLEAVLINPMVPAATALVYAQFDKMGPRKPLAPLPAPDWPDAAAAIEGLCRLRNDLTAAAVAIAPAIADVVAALRAAPGARIARLSGSGATMYALADSAAVAHEVAEGVRRQRPDWWVRTARLADS
ncbi:MAG: 4-(cytidine 5'-diphospho)-2-C-methyl-D-erythritol kinase [Hyphomonadaceae bacterium]